VEEAELVEEARRWRRLSVEDAEPVEDGGASVEEAEPVEEPAEPPGPHWGRGAGRGGGAARSAHRIYQGATSTARARA
jgi:hypothetical protein